MQLNIEFKFINFLNRKMGIYQLKIIKKGYYNNKK